MKVRELIKNLTEFDMDADVLVSTGNTFDDVSDFSLSWGGPDSGDGETKDMAKFVYINLNGQNHGFSGDAVVKGVFADASGAVAAHFAPGAVGIIKMEPEVGNLRLAHGHEAVGTGEFT